jgi:nicotinic acid mononucleotide adenylyltransferase
VVIARPGASLDAAVARVPELGDRIRRDGDRAKTTGATGVYLVEARTRDVSSTVVRARLAARQPIDDLVPAAVARHILAHHLYGAVDELHGQDTRSDSQGV